MGASAHFNFADRAVNASRLSPPALQRANRGFSNARRTRCRCNPHIVDYLQPVEGPQLYTMRYTKSEARRRDHTDSMACPLTVVRITPSPRSSDPDNDANSSLARMLVTLSTSSVLQPQACEMMAPRLRA